MGAEVMRRQRADHWERRLLAHIDRHQTVFFGYGDKKQDCAGFVFGAVVEILEDPSEFEDHLEKRSYKTLKGAHGVLKKYYGGSMEGLADYYFDRLPTPMKAKRGDIVTCTFPEYPEQGPCLGIVIDERCAFMTDYNIEGVSYVPISEVDMAWEV